MTDYSKVSELSRNLAGITQARDHIAKARDALATGMPGKPVTHEGQSVADPTELKELKTRRPGEANEEFSARAAKLATVVEEFYDNVVNDVRRAAKTTQALRDLPRRDQTATTPQPDVIDVDFVEIPNDHPK